MKRGTKEDVDCWDTSRRTWSHMVLHLPHTEGVYGVTFNDVTKDVSYYTTTSCFVVWLGSFPQERQRLWLSKDDLRDSSSLSAPPLLLLRDIHCKLSGQYDCKEVCVSSQSQVNVGTSTRLISQDDVSQQPDTSPLSLPKLDRLFETSFVWDEISVSNVDVVSIPSHHKVTQQILIHCQPFLDLKLMFPGSRHAEQLGLYSQQRIVTTV